jgi:hypothetical protein
MNMDQKIDGEERKSGVRNGLGSSTGIGGINLGNGAAKSNIQNGIDKKKSIGDKI